MWHSASMSILLNLSFQHILSISNNVFSVILCSFPLFYVTVLLLWRNSVCFKWVHYILYVKWGSKRLLSFRGMCIWKKRMLESILPMVQVGFRRRSGAMETIIRLVGHIQKVLAHGKMTLYGFLHIDSLYDHVVPSLLHKHVVGLNIPNIISNFICNLIKMIITCSKIMKKVWLDQIQPTWDERRVISCFLIFIDYS